MWSFSALWDRLRAARPRSDTPRPPGGWSSSAAGRQVGSICATVRQYPSTAWVPLAVLLALTAAGVAAVLVASNAHVDSNLAMASLDATAAADQMTQLLHDMMQPLFSMSLFIQKNPYYPTVAQQFPDVARQLMSQVEHLSASSYSHLELAPMGQILEVYPINNFSVLALGLDLLAVPGTAFHLNGHNQKLKLIGPIPMVANGLNHAWAMGGVAVIFMPNVSRNERFGMPETLPVECPPLFNDLCYIESDKSKLWGFVWSLISFDEFLVGPSNALASLRQKGYTYALTQETFYLPDGSGPALPPTPGFYAPDGSNLTVLARSDGDLKADPVVASINLTSVEEFIPWTLMITSSSGWQPSWKYPVIAAVVVLALVIAVLLFILLLYMRQHQRLLYALVPRNVVQSMFHGDAFEAVVKGQDRAGKEGGMMLQAGTPVEKLMELLTTLMMGKTPELRDVVSVRAAFMQGGDKLFEPQDLKAQLQMDPELEDDVVSALLRELQGLRRTNTDNPPMAKQGSVGSGEHECPALGALLLPVGSTLKANPSRAGSGCGEDEFSTNSTLQGALPLPAVLAFMMQDTERRLGAARASPSGGIPGPALRPVLPGRTSLPGAFPAEAPSGEGILIPLRAAQPPSLASIDEAVESILGARRASCNIQLSKTSAPAGMEAADRDMGPQAPPVDMVQRLLEESYGSWTFNVFELSDATDGHPLSCMLFFLLSRSGLIKEFNLNPGVTARLSLALEDGYRDNPYHNKAHAADVLQTMHAILVNSGMVVAAGKKGYCPPSTLLACLLAAAGHDLCHTVVTNDFLIQSEDDLAILYSDKSPMEHLHLASLFTLMKSPDLNVLGRLPKEERRKIRKVIIDLISGTDMKSHFSIISQFSTMHQLDKKSTADIVSGPPAVGSKTSLKKLPPSAVALPLDDTDQMVVLQVVLKCADLGHIAESLEVHCRWVYCLEEEFFAQGDRERESGLPISPLFDRSKPGASKSQIGFYDFVVFPLFHNFSCVFPGARPMVDLAVATYKFWKLKLPAADSTPRSSVRVTITSDIGSEQKQKGAGPR